MTNQTTVPVKTKIPNELCEIAKTLHCEATYHKDFLVLKPSPSVGQGTITCLSLQRGILAINFNLKLRQDTVLNLNNIDHDLVQFFFTLKGDFIHSFSNSDVLSPLEEMHSAIAHAQPGVASRLRVNSNEQLVFNIIIADRDLIKNQGETNSFGLKLKELVLLVDKQNSKFRPGGFNLKIAEQLKQIKTDVFETDLTGMLTRKGRHYLILAKHLEQFFIQKELQDNDSGLLKRELKQIARLGDMIKEKPELPHKIQSFCLESGLSPAKLQDGFKFMYGRTVANQVRHIRLEKAEFLLRTTELSVSEVVYSVGLTSRSYFCKIFKTTYGCSPKEYKNKVLV